MRKILVAVPFVAVAVALAANAASGRPEKSAAIPGCAKSNLNLIDEGKLSLATDNPAFPPWWGGTPKKPWEVSDPYSGKGYESAVAYGIARRLGFTKNQVTWTAVPFNKSFAPGKKDFDFYMAQVSYKPERAKNVSFSGPYYFVNQAVVGLKGKPITKVKTLRGLKQYELGAQIGTTSYQYIVRYIRPSQTPAVYDSNADAISALKAGQLDGLVVDFPSTGYITGVQVPNSTVVGRLPTKGPKEYFSALFQKGNPLVRCVNAALRRMRADGSLRRLEIKWLSQSGGAPILR